MYLGFVADTVSFALNLFMIENESKLMKKSDIKLALRG